MKKSETYYVTMKEIIDGNLGTDAKIEILEVLMADWKMAKWSEDQKEAQEEYQKETQEGAE